MEIIKDCKVCFFSYDTEKHAPRSLPCGHTLCSQCIASILSSDNLRRCPFDNHAFTSSQNSVDSFPLNYVLLEFLEQTHGDTCQIHFGEKLKFICLTDERKLCYVCVGNGEHDGHIIKKIKELKAEGEKVKGELESTLLQIRKYEENKENDCEIIRKKFISSIDEKCREIKDIIGDKQLEWVSYVNNIFDADKQKGSEDTFALKQQLDETIEDIKYASYDDDDDLIVLEKVIHNDQSIAKMSPESLKERSLGVQNKFLEMQKSLEQDLGFSKEIVGALQLSSKEVVKEIYSVKEEKELSEIQQKLRTRKFVSYFDVRKTEEGLEISMWPDQPREIEVNDEDFKELEAIDINLGRFDFLMREPTPNLLTHIFRNRLEKLTSLEVSFDSKEFNRYSVSWLANIISDSVQSLKSFSLDLEKCHVCGETLRYFCNLVFPKMRNLKDFYLYLNSSQIHYLHLEIWVNALTPLQSNLECFALGLTNNHVTDGEILRVSEMIQSMDGLKNLQLILSRTEITDRSLEVIGDNILPHLKDLDSFTLCVGKCQVSDRGMLSIFKNLKNLKNLELYLSETLITDQTGEVLFDEVIPKLKPFASITFLARNTQVRRNVTGKFAVMS